MKIIIATYGSRGDLQPILALSLALQSHGHEVLLCAQPEDGEWVKSTGCPYYPLGGNLREFGKQHSGPQSSNLKNLNAAILFLRQEIRNQFKILLDILGHADIVLGASVVYALPSVAEYLHIPYRYIVFCPQFIPSSQHPYVHFSNQQMPPFLNRIAWRLGYLFENISFKKTINHERDQLGMQPMKDVWHNKLGENAIVASDPLLGRVPSDKRITCVQTGYFHLPTEENLDSDLQDFIDIGPKPVYIGFGSMLSEKNNDEFNAWVKLVSQATQHRLIVSGGPNSHGKINECCYAVDNVPHNLLFPQMAAVVHHGGAGTTATTARAGIPQIIVPHFFDQFYWAHHIAKQGLGPKPIPRSNLSVGLMAKTINECLETSTFKSKAIDVAHHLKDQDPLGDAIRYIESSVS
jgi:UDP:flavonoid glycosyltransferase YjiC (YdhE family)